MSLLQQPSAAGQISGFLKIFKNLKEVQQLSYQALLTTLTWHFFAAPPEVVCILNTFSGHVDSLWNSLWDCCWRTVLTDDITWVFTCQTKAGKRRLYFLSTSLPHSHSCASDFPNFSSSPLVSSPYVALCIRWPSATTLGSGQTELLRNVPLFNGWPSGPQHGSTSPSLTARGLSFWRREGVEGSFQTNFPI